MFSLMENEILVLRTCDENMCGHGGFRWPTGGRVEAPDWDGLPKCGGGLHGLPKGVGSAQYLDHSAINWLIVKVDTAAGYVEFDGKCKFKGGEVVFVGGQAEAVKLLQEQYPSEPVVFGTATAGDRGTATAGYEGTATAGDWGTATAGDRGTATAGDRGTATAGNLGTATAGDWGTATAGDWGTATAGNLGTATAGVRGTATAGYEGTATAGDWGTATAGYEGTATAGDRGTATAGDRGTATAGNLGTATAGDWGTATAGDRGVLVIDYKTDVGYSRAMAAVDGESIKPSTPYRCENGVFVEANGKEER